MLPKEDFQNYSENSQNNAVSVFKLKKKQLGKINDYEFLTVIFF